MRDYGLGFMVPGSGVRGLGLGFQVQGSGLRTSSFGLRVSGMGVEGWFRRDRIRRDRFRGVKGFGIPHHVSSPAAARHRAAARVATSNTPPLLNTR